MSEVVRLTLVSHAMTDAMAAGRFPTDEPLSAAGHRQVDAAVELGQADTACCGPEKRTRQTAELLGLRAVVDPQLADLDCGRWRGDVLGGVHAWPRKCMTVRLTGAISMRQNDFGGASSATRMAARITDG